MSGKNREESPISQTAQAAGAVRGAVKTGKAIANLSKGAAAGPYAMAAAGLWEGRHILAKAAAAIAALFLLPVMFILMLPSLIFGSNGLNDVPANVLNDNTVIMANIAEVETGIEAILREKHDAVLRQIEAEANGLGSNCEYSITDDFSDRIIYESALIISQFCASQADYQEVKLSKLEQILRAGTDGIFSYTVDVTSWTETDPETGASETYYHYEYTMQYAGDSYFADHVFHLTGEQVETAGLFASNLHLFLFDTVYNVEINPDLIPGETGNAAVDLALTKLGIPYSQALRNQEGYFDCSSFTYWVYKQLGLSLQYDGSNTAAAQGRYIAENHLAIAYEDLAPGDLIFYSFKVNNRYMNISHIAIYAGDGYVVDASYSKKKVVYRPIYSLNNIVLCGRPYASP
ncbi:MAG: NlpC/P60 family protein [Hungatella hathewayi]|uniref:C40 family peptidase n=1 Tax=Hungatella TaxID=1649459 RepID=UPI001FAAAA46|nr:NlpC/P60 family protein [Hungatella hathewayi]MDU4976740.1 NlpC/P60 family protein [Hungatella hathewayi]